MWDEITYPFLNLNGAAVEVWEWIGNFIPHFIEHMITYPYRDQCQSMFLVKWVPGFNALIPPVYTDIVSHCMLNFIDPLFDNGYHIAYGFFKLFVPRRNVWIFNLVTLIVHVAIGNKVGALPLSGNGKISARWYFYSFKYSLHLHKL